MGRPPCCDKEGVKKGPWTPEEDIILVSYIQEQGPGNWRAVPTNTGLLRCSKSCRLRWTNYLRPGIKRGNFTPHEEGMIIHLQALLGNKWAAIASYLPQRTDNDIKNYWNTHLKKKLNRYQQSSVDPHHLNNPQLHHHHPRNNMGSSSSGSSSNGVITSVHTNSPSSLLPTTTNSSSLTSFSSSNNYYASSTENISRLLEGWMRTSPKNNRTGQQLSTIEHGSCEHLVGMEEEVMVPNKDNQLLFKSSSSLSNPLFGNMDSPGQELMWHKAPASHECFEKDQMVKDEDHGNGSSDHHPHHHNRNNPPFSIFEKWLFDEPTSSGGGQVEDMMQQLSPIF